MTETALLEPSFANLIEALDAAIELSPSVRAHWLCSGRQIGKALDKPLELIPARWTSVRFPIIGASQSASVANAARKALMSVLVTMGLSRPSLALPIAQGTAGDL